MANSNFQGPISAASNPVLKKQVSLNKVKHSNNFHKLLAAESKKTIPQNFKTVTDLQNVNRLKENKNKVQQTENGIDLAARKLARDFEGQFIAFMWNEAFSTSGKLEGNIEEEFLQKEIVGELAKNFDENPLGDLGEAIYKELKVKMQK